MDAPMARAHMNALHEEFIDATVANLKVIGMLQRNDKLCVHKGQLCVDRTAGVMQGVRRWLNRDGRDVTLVHLRTAVTDAVRIARAVASGVAAGQQQDTPDLRDWTLRRLIDEMAAAEAGLVSLRSTYLSDSSFVAALDVLAERLRANGELLAASSTGTGTGRAATRDLEKDKDKDKGQDKEEA